MIADEVLKRDEERRRRRDEGEEDDEMQEPAPPTKSAVEEAKPKVVAKTRVCPIWLFSVFFSDVQLRFSNSEVAEMKSMGLQPRRLRISCNPRAKLISQKSRSLAFNHPTYYRLTKTSSTRTLSIPTRIRIPAQPGHLPHCSNRAQSSGSMPLLFVDSGEIPRLNLRSLYLSRKRCPRMAKAKRFLLDSTSLCSLTRMISGLRQRT